jgi:hypothetical protein
MKRPAPKQTPRERLVVLVRRMRRAKPKGGQMSLREISAELAARGHFNERGQPYAAASIQSMLGPRSPRAVS